MKSKPPDHLVAAIALDADPTDSLLTWMTLETPAGVARVALSRDAVEQLWDMLDQTMAAWTCDCPRCTAEREAEEAKAARMH